VTLDDETIALLGWGNEPDRFAPLAKAKPPRTRRIGRKRDEVKFDGRSRRNWRHLRKAQEGLSVPSGAKSGDGIGSEHG
jgi:hypothetical protein